MDIKHDTLSIIVDDLTELHRQALRGEEMDLELLDDTNVKLEDKIDATIYIEGMLDARVDHLRKIKAQLQEEINWTLKEKDKVRDHMANELARLGVKTIMTALHRVTLRLSDWKLTPIIPKKVKSRSELEGKIDERCILEEVSFSASRSLAKQILKEDGEIPEGFEASRKNSLMYKKGKLEDE